MILIYERKIWNRRCLLISPPHLLLSPNKNIKFVLWAWLGSPRPHPEVMTVFLAWFLPSVFALSPHFLKVFGLSSSYSSVMCRLTNLPTALVLPGLGDVQFFFLVGTGTPKAYGILTVFWRGMGWLYIFWFIQFFQQPYEGGSSYLSVFQMGGQQRHREFKELAHGHGPHGHGHAACMWILSGSVYITCKVSRAASIMVFTFF